MCPNWHCAEDFVSNVIAFENPIPKIYDTLPPPKEEIEEVLAPTQDDYARALLLVRRNILILNHFDYNDVSYAEDAPIVSVEYFQKGSNRNAEGISVHDDLNDDGTEEGDFGPSIKNMTRDQMIGIAAMHLDNEGKFMRTSHAENPESLWNNPQLYPKMFPWLFPFGLGGIGASDIKAFSESSHLKFLLLYHDK
ncbi:hypothetical protein F5879DRAFT_1012921 [Lentinula edodes]|nr:hypothetical protein F5879DRAFT_1012921 [Lentinula edodes]